MTPLVSILIPCYNAAPWLAQTLESVLAQTWPRNEIIVIDDGSSDGSLARARSFAPRGVRVISQPNRGASAARNHGLRLAQGEFIQFLDADDLLSPDKISAQVELLMQSNTGGVATCRWGRFTADPAQAAFVDEAIFRDFSPVEFLLLHTGKGRMMHPAAWLVPAAIAQRAGSWDERLSLNDDGEYFTRVVLAAGRIAFANSGASFYRSNLASSLSQLRSRRALESLALSVELISSRFQLAEDSPRVQRALADYWQRLVYELYPDAPDLRRQAEARVQALGGSALKPEMGGRERAIAAMFGWKIARRLRRVLLLR